MTMNCGIYEIRHTASNKRYIGSSATIKKRWKEHRGHLRRGTHHSAHLQASWNKHGQAAFEFKVLVVCSPDMLFFYEQALLDGLQPAFNVLPTAGSMRGHVISDEVKKTMGAAQRRWRPQYEWKGQQMALSDIAEAEAIRPDTLISRVIGMGLSVEQAVARGHARETNRLYEHAGRSLTRSQWASELGMHPRRLDYWMADGLTISQCVARLNREAKALSLQQFAALSAIPYQTVRSRLKKTGIGAAVIQHLQPA